MDSASSASSSWVVIFTAAERAVREATGAPMKALAEPKARARVTVENCIFERIGRVLQNVVEVDVVNRFTFE